MQRVAVIFRWKRPIWFLQGMMWSPKCSTPSYKCQNWLSPLECPRQLHSWSFDKTWFAWDLCMRSICSCMVKIVCERAWTTWTRDFLRVIFQQSDLRFVHGTSCSFLFSKCQPTPCSISVSCGPKNLYTSFRWIDCQLVWVHTLTTGSSLQLN